MRLLFDTNVVLDVLLVREPWAKELKPIWEARRVGRVQGFVAATSLTNIFYIARRLSTAERARQAVRSCMGSLAVIPVDAATVEMADRLPGQDLEDNLQIACALVAGLDGILTRDVAGFAGSPVRAYSPADVRRLLA
jgi:predicted nucleic acid-binding protein